MLPSDRRHRSCGPFESTVDISYLMTGSRMTMCGQFLRGNLVKGLACEMSVVGEYGYESGGGS